LLFLDVPATLAGVSEADAVRVATELMHERGWNVRDLAREADLDPGTVGDFLAGTRWPRMGTRGRIEKALGIDPGELDRTRRGEPTVTRRNSQPGPEVDPRPVGLGLDDEASDLLPEQVEAIRALIRSMKPPESA
jgi:transcriptional regulator with XRE-family HTH domain